MAVSLAFIFLGVLLLWDPPHTTSLVGLIVAVTPMVIFTSAVISPSGAEVASALCLIAALIRLWRDPLAAGAAYALGASGFVLAIGRPLGPVWVVLGAGLLIVLLGRQNLCLLWASAPRRNIALAALVAIGATANLVWQVAVLAPGARSISEVLSFIGPSIGALPETFGEAIGVFGWQDTLMPRPVYGVWGLALIALIAAALLVGRLREIRTVELVLLASGALTVALSAFAVMPTGFAIQGRYMLPALITVPFLSGEVMHRNRNKAKGSWASGLVVVLAACVALVQLAGWYSNAHRYAVGRDGPWLFLTSAQWQPRLGWPLLLAVATAGAACIIASVLPLPAAIRRGR
jgi:hypothetical protein